MVRLDPSPKWDTFAKTVKRHDLSVAQRKDYVKAVLCLQSKSPKSPRDQFPGALNRYDDFVATHESMAFELHSTVSSLALFQFRVLLTVNSPISSRRIVCTSGPMKRHFVKSVDTLAISL